MTADGIPLGCEVVAGNRNDATTVKEIVAAMEQKYGRANRIWVMDRGMVSEENLKFLRERQGQYIVGTPKAMLQQFEQYLTSKDWHEVQEGVEVQLVSGPEGDETFVLARSVDRRESGRVRNRSWTDVGSINVLAQLNCKGLAPGLKLTLRVSRTSVRSSEL